MLPNKAVFPVAGLGTRFYPATLVTPKELMPINGKPLIQYAVEEAIAAGITDIIFITHPRKKLIEEHFMQLQADKNAAMLSDEQFLLMKKTRFHFINQSEPKGLGHAVYQAKSIINDEPFLLSLCDEFLAPETHSCIEDMVRMYQKNQASVIALTEVAKEDVIHYGIAKMAEKCRLVSVIEKPSVEEAPSNVAMIGRYLLSGGIFDCLSPLMKKETGDEIQLTDALNTLISRERVFGYTYTGARFDCGQPPGYLNANLYTGMRDPVFKEKLVLPELEEMMGAS